MRCYPCGLIAVNILDKGEPAHAERPGQHGDKPAELVGEKVLH